MNRESAPYVAKMEIGNTYCGVKEQSFCMDVIVDKMFRNIDNKIGTCRRVGCKNREQWHKGGLFFFLWLYSPHLCLGLPP
jgi:hypothetical protein